jgi:hypothetical protein
MSEVTLLVSSSRPATAATTTRVRRERVPKLNPKDEQAVLFAAAVVPEKVEGAEDNDGDEPRPLPQRASFALYPVSCVLFMFHAFDFLASIVCIV